MDRITALFRPHSRFERNRSAFADGELGAAELERFQAHLSGCERCATALEDERAIRQMLSVNLPEVPAPRSFRLTEAMVAGTSPRPAPASAGGHSRPQVRSQVMVMSRVSQATAALAAFALVAVFAFDVTSGPSNDFSRSADLADADDAGAEFEAGTTGLTSDEPAEVKPGDGDKPHEGQSPAPDETLPEPDGGVSGSGVTDPPVEPGNGPDNRDSAPAEDLPLNDRTTVDDQQYADDAGEFVPTALRGQESGPDRLRALQVGLGIVLLSALAAMFIARSQVRRDGV